MNFPRQSLRSRSAHLLQAKARILAEGARGTAWAVGLRIEQCDLPKAGSLHCSESA